jgi:hypothetical protein
MEERTQYIFLDSSKCAGSPYDFVFHLPQHLIKCDPQTEKLRISLIKWTLRHDWYVIRQPYNYFVIRYNNVETLLTIPEGNYTYSEFALKLKELITANKASFGESGAVNVTYSSITNKLKFIFSTSSNIRHIKFPTEKGLSFGFAGGVYYELSTVLESLYPMNFYEQDERILIYLDGVQTHQAKSVHHDTSNKLNDHGTIIGSVLINNVPFETIVYENDGKLYAHYLSDKKIQGELRVRLKTLDGVDADFIKHHHLVLRVDVIKDKTAMEDLIMKRLETIEEYMRLTLLSNHLKNTGDLPTNP